MVGTAPVEGQVFYHTDRDDDIIVVGKAWRLELTRWSPWNSARLLYLKGILALPTARNSIEVARAR